ncbi:hypothetical protein GQ600_8864 [Phytophthora cactorum]|nr:hypothetical protein GQ600_8864 [Phytophthora cactorum]
MKKRVSSMQHEIESLQAALRQARAGDSSGHSNQSSVRDTWSTDCWPEDDPQQGDDLDDVQLFPAEVMNRQHSRPHGVPMLSFATLPSYSDEVRKLISVHAFVVFLNIVATCGCVGRR